MSGRFAPADRGLSGKNVLVVEDDYHVATDIASLLQKHGVTVIGPAADRAAAEELLGREHVDFALLDVNLNGDLVFPLVEILTEKNVPYVFITGYDPDLIPEPLRGAPVLSKPIRNEDIERTLWPEPKGRSGVVNVPIANAILKILPVAALDVLRPHMSLIPLSPRKTLLEPGDVVEKIYFPESGILSVMLGMRSKPVEVALVGFEGCLGHWSLLQPSSPFRVMVQSPGFAITVPVSKWRECIDAHRDADRLLQCYMLTFALQLGMSAASAASQSLEERLARWLLMCADRVGVQLPFVHEYISFMLNVRRAGVTNAIHVLEGEGAIKATRANLEITDREKLRRIAGWSYGLPEEEYRRLIK